MYWLFLKAALLLNILVPSENRSTIKKVVNESLDSELPSDLEEFTVVDAAESD